MVQKGNGKTYSAIRRRVFPSHPELHRCKRNI